MKKRWFILGIVLIFMLILGMFVYFSTAAPSKPAENVENPSSGLSEADALAGFNSDYVNYLVFAIGGWKLHNSPVYNEKPVIKVTVDGENFASEIANGVISTEKKDIDNADIEIITSKQEIINSIRSGDIKKYVQDSIAAGKTSLELKAGYSTLFSKGYLNLYKDITGKGFTGSAVRIFEQG